MTIIIIKYKYILKMYLKLLNNNKYVIPKELFRCLNALRYEEKQYILHF